MDSKRRRCGRKGLLELRPEVAEPIRNALVDNDKQCYRDLAGMVGEPLCPVYRACQKLKVQLYVAHKDPTQTVQLIKDDLVLFKMILEGKDTNGFEDSEFELRAWKDEKWFYCERMRQFKKVLPGMEKKRIQVSRHFPIKTMISAVTGIPRPEHNFDGVILAKRVAKMKTAKRRSWQFDRR